MQIYTANGTALRGDLVTRVVQRTDLTPIPSTIELEAIATAETTAALEEGLVVQVGADMTPYLLIKSGVEASEAQRGSREVRTIRATGILSSCSALARRLQRSIIREGTSFSEIYRSIGATAQVDTDFSVPRFAALIGCLPTLEIARVLQEEAAAVFYQNGTIKFRRLTELSGTDADITFAVDRTISTASDLLERNAVPFAFSTAPDNSIISTKRESSRGVIYRPRADSRILNNLGVALVLRRKLRQGLSPTLNAGARIDIAGERHIVITAAHVRALANDGNDGEEYTQLWLGQVVT